MAASDWDQVPWYSEVTRFLWLIQNEANEIRDPDLWLRGNHYLDLQQGIETRKRWLRVMIGHPLLFKECLFGAQTVLQRLVTEMKMKMLFFDWKANINYDFSQLYHHSTKFESLVYDVTMPRNFNECLQDLEYLTSVGYTNEHVNTLKNYFREQQYDVDAIKEDLDDIEQCLVLDESREQNPDWDERRVKDFYCKIRQAVGLDPKAYTAAQNAIPHSKIKPENISFKITQRKLEQHHDDYLQYCPHLLPMHQTGRFDKALIRAIAAGRENGTSLLQHIADTYCRARINEYARNSTANLSPTWFCNEYKYFKTLQERDATAVKSALHSFHKRICPTIEFASSSRINDSLPMFFKYTAAMINNIKMFVTKGIALPPFQVHFLSTCSIKSCLYY